MYRRPAHLQRLYQDYAQQGEWFGPRLCCLLQPHVPDGQWKGIRVLDIGSGDGIVGQAFVEKGAHVFGLDLDLGRVAAAKERRRSATLLTPSYFVGGDAGQIPFRDSSIDVVVLSDVLEHVIEPRRTLGEVARVLTRGGVAYVATTNRWSLLTLLTDPHYNVPGVNLLPRRVAAWYVTQLWRVSSTYNVGEYFSKPGLRRLFRAAALVEEEVRDMYEDKIRSGKIAAALGRSWLIGLLRYAAVQRTAIALTRSAFFNFFVQPSFHFLAFRPMFDGSSIGP